MFLACFIAAASVLTGAALGLSRKAGRDVLGPVRTFAFAAAAAVVVAVFIPESMETLGALALLPFVAGFFAPLVLERVMARSSKRSRGKGAALEIGYLGLVVHQIGDGLGMGSFTGPSHESHSHLDIFLAVGGHTVPIAALVVLAFAEQKGRAVALRRALGLALAVVAGVVVARFADVSLESSTWGGLLSAVVGGLLLHIATHDMGEALPRSPATRAIDLAAAAAGVLVVLAGGSEHGHASEHHDLVPVLQSLALRTAPPLLLVMATAFARPSRPDRQRLVEAGGLVAAALTAVVLGAHTAIPMALALLAMALVWPTRKRGHEPAPPTLASRLASAGALGLFGAVGLGAAAFVELAFGHTAASLGLHIGGAIVVAIAAAIHPIAAIAPASALLELAVPSPFMFGGLVAGVALRGMIDRRREPSSVVTASATRKIGAAVLALASLGILALLGDASDTLQVPDAVGWIALLADAAFVLGAAFQVGARGFVAGLVEQPGKGRGCHEHDLGHVHWDHAHPRLTEARPGR